MSPFLDLSPSVVKSVKRLQNSRSKPRDMYQNYMILQKDVGSGDG